MRRFVIGLLLAATAAVAAGCGFGRADDTGRPIPGQYWGWVCASGDAPEGDAGCPSPNGDGDVGDGDGSADAGVPADAH